MKQLFVKYYQSINKDIWNDFVSKSPYATFLFNRDFMDYHQDRFNDCSLMVYQDDELLALVPANRLDDMFCVHKGLSYGSVIFIKEPPLQPLIEVLKSVFSFLSMEGFKTFYYKTLPDFYQDKPLLMLNYLFKKINPINNDIQLFSTIELNKNIKYSKDRKSGIKRGEKHQLKVEESDEFELFWNQILIPQLQNKHQVKPVHTLDEILKLKNAFPNNIKLFLVKHQDNVVAGTVIFETNQVAHSQYIASNDLRSQLGSVDFLHHYLISVVYKNKQYFDFGISQENGSEHINYGLWYWKSGFDTRNFIQNIYTIPIENVHLLNHILI